MGKWYMVYRVSGGWVRVTKRCFVVFAFISLMIRQEQQMMQGLMRWLVGDGTGTGDYYVILPGRGGRVGTGYGYFLS